MAAILPTWQRWYDLPDGKIMGVHRVKLVSSSDTFGTRRPAAHTTVNISAAQLRDEQDVAVTVTQAVATGLVTVVGKKRDEATIVTIHLGGAGSSFGQQDVDTDNQA